MARATGVHAQTPNGFVLARELRERRRAAGFTGVKDVRERLGISRAMIDGLELGAYDVAVDRRHLTKWSRQMFLRLLAEYRLEPAKASAYVQLALLARVFREDESDDPVDAVEWREAGGTPWRGGLDLGRKKAEVDVAAILNLHREAWERHLQLPLPTAVDQEAVVSTGPSPRFDLSGISPAAFDVLDFLVHATIGTAPARLLERAGVAGGDLQPALTELGNRALIAVGEEQGSQLISLAAHPDRVAASLGRRMSRWRDESWAWRTGLRYLDLAIKDETQRHTALPLGDLRNYLTWLRSGVETGEISEALVAWSKLVRFLWETGRRDLFEEAETLGARAFDQFSVVAPEGARLLRALHMTEVAYLQLERGELLQSSQLAKEGLRVFESIQDFAGQAIAHRYLGLVSYRLGSEAHLDAARREYEAALGNVHEVAARGLESGTVGQAIAQLRDSNLLSALVVGYRIYAGETAPIAAETHNLLASVLMKLGQLATAIRHATRSIELYRSAPNRWPGSEAAAFITRGRCRLLQHDRSRARTDFRTAIRVALRAERRELARGAHIRLAELEAEIGRKAEALAEAKAAEDLGVDENSDDGERIRRLRRNLEARV